MAVIDPEAFNAVASFINTLISASTELIKAIKD